MNSATKILSVITACLVLACLYLMVSVSQMRASQANLDEQLAAIRSAGVSSVPAQNSMSQTSETGMDLRLPSLTKQMQELAKRVDQLAERLVADDSENQNTDQILVSGLDDATRKEQERKAKQEYLDDVAMRLTDPDDHDPYWTPIIAEKIDTAFANNEVLKQATNYTSQCISDHCKVSAELPASIRGSDLDIFGWTLLQAFAKDLPSATGGYEQKPGGGNVYTYVFRRGKGKQE